MKKFVLRAVAIGVIGYASYGAYDLYSGGYFSAPSLPDGAYLISFKNGLRAIVLNAEVPDEFVGSLPTFMRLLSIANRDRKYLGLPFEVQPWFEDAWSWCKAPTGEERQMFRRLPDDTRRTFENSKFEAVCYINVDGKELARGMIFSVPKL